MSLRPGDVVFGKFPTADGTVLNHYSVVLMANDEGALLAYTTSMKENIHRGNPANRFTTDDSRLANFTNPGLWDASQCAVVPLSAISLRGRITKATFEKVQMAYARARQSKILSTAMLTPTGEVVYH